jgi:formate dehydrogenase
MVFARSLPRFVRPASSFFTATAARSSATARGATYLRQRFAAPQIRTLTGAREKVKVLLVLYDGQSQTSSMSNKTAQLIEHPTN